jgi:N-acetylmuramoyl-L-alanine amidase
MSSDAGSIPAASIESEHDDGHGKLKKIGAWALAGTVVFAGAVSFSAAQSQPVLKLTARDADGSSRVILSSTAALPFSFQKRAGSLVVFIETARSLRVQQDPIRSDIIDSVGWSRGKDAYTFTIELKSLDFTFEHSARRDPFELTVDIKPAPVKAETQPVPRPPDPAVEQPVAARPVPAAATTGAKFKTIVIDPGHGGIEIGAKGKFGLLEKDVTLAIALKLRDIIEKNLAFRVFLTRDKDTDVALESRAALANNHKADLFISIHANGSLRKNARGSETYFLSLNATDEDARRLAYLENATGKLEGRLEQDSQDDIKMILWDLAQSAYLKQSSELAGEIQAELNRLLGTENRGVKQAPFKVLTGAACPAVLVETAFISNPEEEKELGSGAFQDNVAQAIYRSLVEYLKLFP